MVWVEGGWGAGESVRVEVYGVGGECSEYVGAGFGVGLQLAVCV